MDVWSWICDLPSSPEWTQPNPSPFIYQLTTLKTPNLNKSDPPRSILLKAELCSDESGVENWMTFSICIQGVSIQGFHLDGISKIVWLSDPCHLSSDMPYLPLVVQLIQEIINRAPNNTGHDHTLRGPLIKVKPDPIVRILQTNSLESFSGFFNVLLLTRLFWLCACDAPSEIGSLYFQSLLAPNIELLSRDIPVLKDFLRCVGADIELRFSRAIGYMLSKWLIAREMRVGIPSVLPLTQNLTLSYASESCGLWLMRGYAPTWAMDLTRCPSNKREGYPFVDAKESALRYSLAHQQLEAHIQFEYNVQNNDNHILVTAHVDNIRIHVVKLGFNTNTNTNKDDVHFNEELYFPSRIETWVGPEPGSNYVAGLTLSKSTENIERENETQKQVKGSFGKTKKIKTASRTSTKTKMKNWRWDQDVEGNMAIFDGVLYENTSGIEVYSVNLVGGASAYINNNNNNNNNNNGNSYNNNSNLDVKKGDDLARRYSRVNRPFLKSGGVVFVGKDEYGDELVKWRLSKEMEGKVLKWRIGGKIWLSYWPSQFESCYYETRSVEWSHEVDLPLIPTKLVT